MHGIIQWLFCFGILAWDIGSSFWQICMWRIFFILFEDHRSFDRFRLTFCICPPPSGAAVQPVRGAPCGGGHLWLWRQHHRGVVCTMDAAWGLLPIYEKPQWWAERCETDTVCVFCLGRRGLPFMCFFHCVLSGPSVSCIMNRSNSISSHCLCVSMHPSASGALCIWAEGPGSHAECVEPSLHPSPVPLHTLSSCTHFCWHCSQASLHGVCVLSSLSSIVLHKWSF